MQKFKLTKPHYTLIEAADRLRAAGHDIYSTNDLLQVLYSGRLAPSLLVNYHQRFISKNFAIPFHNPNTQAQDRGEDWLGVYDYENFETDHYPNDHQPLIPLVPVSSIDMALAEGRDLSFEKGSIKQAMYDLSLVGEMYQKNLVRHSIKSEPLTVTPVVISSDCSEPNSFEIHPLKENVFSQLAGQRSVLAVLIDNEIFFPAMSTDEESRNQLEGIEVQLPNGLTHRPIEYLEQERLYRLIKDKQFIIMNDALQNYLDETADEKYQQDDSNTQKQRELLLDNLVKELGYERVVLMGQQETLSHLRQMDEKLFSPRSKATWKRFFRIQQIVKFNPGRRSSIS